MNFIRILILLSAKICYIYMILNIKTLFEEYSETFFKEYGIITVSLVFGIIIGWNLKLFLADRKYNKQKDIRLKEKDERIAELNYMVYERLVKVSVKEQDKGFIKMLKKSFKKFSTIKK
jgi:hypothetical protein